MSEDTDRQNTPSRSIMWFRRDLRLGDNPALLSAIDHGPDGVLGVFVLDQGVWAGSGKPRQAFLLESLRELAADWESCGGTFVVRRGDPAKTLPRLVSEYGAGSVHVTGDTTPFSTRRDDAVEAALGDTPLVRTGSPYAVTPGRVRKDDDTPYRVYTPFYRAWSAHGWHSPAHGVRTIPASSDKIDGIDLPRTPEVDGLPKPGEKAARARWREFLKDDVADYDSARDRPDLDATSRLSPYLHFGAIHPRTMLADLADRSGSGPSTFRKELAWRDFYGDVLFHNPASAHDYYDEKFTRMKYDSGKTADERFTAWAEGRTGYPMVDAGMRQLLAEGWMHNRVRMIVASFLVKDLHLEWTQGAKHFMDHLVDGDIASNQHGWQWVAGCGTDAAPYFRIFNPVSQGEKFDPQGDYVRRYVPELAGIAGKAAHTPWDTDDCVPDGYVERIVDHKVEREESLKRYNAIKG